MRHFSFIVLLFAAICSGAQTRFDSYIKNVQPASKQEGITNVKPSPFKIVGQWTPYFTQEMNDVWQSISLKGVNYYSLAEPLSKEGYSERGNYKSKYYQAWFGTYVIDAKAQLFSFPNDKINSLDKEVIEKLLSIGVLDQSSWLYAMGDPDGLSSTKLVRQDKYNVIGHFTIDGENVPVIEFSMTSHSDLTDTKTDLSGFVGMPPKQSWQGELSAYHDITIKGIYLYWYDRNDKTLKIIYGTACSFKTKDGTVTDTYADLKDDMLKMASSVSYMAVK